jgi:hypothetical protein
MKDNMSPIINEKLHKSMIAGKGGILQHATRNSMMPHTPSANGHNVAREGLPELIHKRRYKNRINFNSMFTGNQLAPEKNNAIFSNKVSKDVMTIKYANKRNPNAHKHHDINT